MKQILILGNSYPSAQIALQLRALNPDCKISILLTESQLPYYRDQLAGYLAGVVSEKNIFCHAKDVYIKNKIELLTDLKVSRINPKRNKIFTSGLDEEKIQIDFDLLFITDAVDLNLPDIKGGNKTGVFGFTRFSDVEQIKNKLPFTEKICVESDSLAGFAMAAALVHQKQQVDWIIPAQKDLGATLKPELIEWLNKKWDGKNLRILWNTSITEVLGDSDAKAIRLSNGKVLDSQMVLFERTIPDLKSVQDSPLCEQEKVPVNEKFKTLEKHIYILNSAFLTEQAGVDFFDRSDLDEQIRVVLNDLENKEYIPAHHETRKIVQYPDFNWIAIGQINPFLQSLEDNISVSDKNCFKKVFIQNERVVGGFLIQCPEQTDELSKMIENKTLVKDLPKAWFEVTSNTDAEDFTHEPVKQPAPDQEQLAN